MCTGENDDFCPEVPDEPVEAAPAQAVESLEKSSLHRRTFLKAAALGSAALAFRSSSTLAHTDTKSPCTAGDIELTGGQIVNEPCECSTPTFGAVAKFHVRNDNNSRRLNITLHMGTCTTFGGQDFVLRTGTDGLSGSCSINGLGAEQDMYAFLGQIPCDFEGVCCPGSVIAFQTAKNQQDAENCAVPLLKYAGGQCRRQEICIVGFGADLTCSTEGCDGAPSDGCEVPCGGTLYLQASATGGTDGANGTYDYVVTAPDGVTTYDSGPGQGGSFCFTITDPQTGTYTLEAFDSNGCARTDTTEVTVGEITVSLDGTSVDCTASGSVSFTATSTGTGSCTYEFFVDGVSQQGPSSENTFIYHPISMGGLDGANHTVSVNVDCSGCTASDSATVNSCISTTVS
jgi:hypothetical protein